jgi:hypothetical protein
MRGLLWLPTLNETIVVVGQRFSTRDITVIRLVGKTTCPPCILLAAPLSLVATEMQVVQPSHKSVTMRKYTAKSTATHQNRVGLISRQKHTVRPFFKVLRKIDLIDMKKDRKFDF